MSSTGRVFNIQRYTIHDGPGIRTEIFLKGCPLSCKWCSNPESMSVLPEVGVMVDRCIGIEKCGWCLDACPDADNGVFQIENDKIVGIDQGKCNGCLQCARQCPADALKAWGRSMSVDEIMQVIMADIEYYRSSGGGVTFSGGEPLVQWPFVQKVLQQCRNKKIHTCIESAMFCPGDVLDEILPWVDLIICDIKHMDSDTHKRYTGVPNERILTNIRRTVHSGKPVVIRIPVIPGHNDTEENINKTAQFISSELHNQVKQVQLLRYRKMGLEKYRALGRAYPLDGFDMPQQEICEREILEYARLMQHLGVPAVAGTTIPY